MQATAVGSWIVALDLSRIALSAGGQYAATGSVSYSGIASSAAAQLAQAQPVPPKRDGESWTEQEERERAEVEARNRAGINDIALKASPVVSAISLVCPAVGVGFAVAVGVAHLVVSIGSWLSHSDGNSDEQIARADAALVRYFGYGLPPPGRTEIIKSAQQYADVLEMLLSHLDQYPILSELGRMVREEGPKDPAILTLMHNASQGAGFFFSSQVSSDPTLLADMAWGPCTLIARAIHLDFKARSYEVNEAHVLDVATKWWIAYHSQTQFAHEHPFPTIRTTAVAFENALKWATENATYRAPLPKLELATHDRFASFRQRDSQTASPVSLANYAKAGNAVNTRPPPNVNPSTVGLYEPATYRGAVVATAVVVPVGWWLLFRTAAGAAFRRAIGL